MSRLGTMRSGAAPVVLPAGGRSLPVVADDGVRLGATVFGDDGRPTLVLAHGYTQQMRTWAYQVADLADRYRVVVYDQRGHGTSAGAPPASLSVARLGDDLDAVLRAAVPEGERAVVAGHSMGGIGIVSWAARHPSRVERRAAAIVLVNTAANRIPDFIPLGGRPRRARAAVPWLVRQRLLAIIQRRARLPLRYLALGDAADERHLDAIMEMISTAPAATLRRYMTAFLAMDLSDDVPKLTVPTTVIAGNRDRLLPPVHSSLLAARLPVLDELYVAQGSGHMSPWEAREAVSGLLARAAERHLSVTHRR